MGRMKVAIAGIGNCASSLIQGVEYYKEVNENSGFVPGILNNTIGSYRIKDIEFVAAFDVNENKINKDLSEAIFTNPNCARRFCDVPNLGISVDRGPILDGIGKKSEKIIPIDRRKKPSDIVAILKGKDAEILINFLPSGSKKATEFYAQQAINANCGFINAIPDSIATNPKWQKKFKKAGLPLAGDDLKSQLGGTILHRALIDLFIKRGVKLEETHQINIGGNMDFNNLSDSSRSQSKMESKNDSIFSLIPYPASIRIVQPYFSGLRGDNKTCYIRLTGKNFGSCPVSINVALSVDDSPNAGGVIVDVIRGMKLARDRGLSGVISEICSYYFKFPPKKCPDDKGYQRAKKFFGGLS